MKLKYRDFVGSHIADAINRIIAIRPAPLADVSHSAVINIRRINAKVADYNEARKALAGGYEKEVRQFKPVLFFVPEEADIDSISEMAGDRARLRRAIAKKDERKDGGEIVPLDWMPDNVLEEFVATDVFNSIDFDSENVPTEPVLIDGIWNFVVLTRSEERKWIFRKDSEQFQNDMEELLDTEIDIEIRIITTEAIKKSEEKRPGFVIPPDDMLTAWFMFEAD